MKNLFIISLALISVSLGFSQDFKTEVGPEFQKDYEAAKYHIVFPSAYGFMAYYSQPTENVMLKSSNAVVLEKHDQSMKSIDSKTYDLPMLGQRAADLAEVIELEDQLVFLSTAMDKKSGKHEVYAQVYSEKEDSMDDQKVLASFPMEKYSKSGFYQVAVSPDQSKIAVFANMPYEKKEQEKVQVWLYDSYFNLLWEQTENLSYDSEKAYQEDVFVTNQGEVVVNKKLDFHKNSKKEDLLIFNGNSVKTTAFSSEDFFPMNMKLINVNNKPMLTGFFWTGGKMLIQMNSGEGEQNDGAFLYDLNEKKILGKHLWADGINYSNLKSLEVTDVKVVNDDIFLIGERQLTSTKFKEGGAMAGMDYFYTFGSSIIVNLDTKGTLKGFTPLFDSTEYKNNESEKASFAALYLANGLHVLSNKNEYITMNSFFSPEETKFQSPSVRIHSTNTTPQVIPSAVKPVEKYNLVYFITNYNNKYWFNKMSW